MAAGRQPLLRGTGQSDADMQGFNILDVGAVGDIQQATLIVEPGIALNSDGQEIGVRGSGLPFTTIAGAVAAAMPGDTIVLRPGVHAFDGTVDIFRLAGLTISGYGAKITSVSEVNETVKFTVRSGSVMFEGMEFDGGVTGTPAVTGSGCIEVSSPGFSIRDCFIHDQNGYGIHGTSTFDGIRIFDCDIELCLGGVLLEAEAVTPTRDTDSVWISRSNFEFNRTNGVALVGSGPSSGFFVTRVQISDNHFTRNDQDSGGLAAIALTFGCQGVLVSSNSFKDESSAIALSQVRDISISDNQFKAIQTNGIVLAGVIGAKIQDNFLDGRSSAGTPTTVAPILAAGQYLAPNDAGQFVITGNELIFLKTASNAVAVSNATGILLNSNRIEGTIVFTACSSVTVNGNQFQIPQTTQAILIDAGNRGSAKFSIIANRFFFTGASISRCITTVDASAFLIDDVLIEANATPTGQLFGIATYGHSGSNPATRVVLIGNVPENFDTTLKNGWRNEGANLAINKSFVSKATGSDASATPQSRTQKYATISAAISASVSGTEVVVEDGTFNELITAKNGISVRFLPGAFLVCTTANGCLASSTAAETFTLWHTHAPIKSSKASTHAVNIGHAGVYEIHADIVNTGTGASHGLNVTASAQVYLYGSVFSDHGNAISSSGGTPAIACLPVFNGNQTSLGTNIWATAGLGVALDGGFFEADGYTIFGGGAHAATLVTANTSYQFRHCRFIATGTAASAVHINATATANVPIFWDCVLISESTATGSLTTTGAQGVKVYGTVIANKGADPPTNISILCGIYDVDADVTTE